MRVVLLWHMHQPDNRVDGRLSAWKRDGTVPVSYFRSRPNRSLRNGDPAP